ncbi:MAG: outer membrane beta-barrel protein [Blastocatellia bacterium]|nr:outer membrane beta-barrel protein [Blastocatellia bacterium]
MIKRTFIALCVLLSMTTIDSSAQEKKIEISASGGYTFSNLIDVGTVLYGDGLRIINQVGPKSGFSWGFQGDYEMIDRISVGALWNRQQSRFRLGFNFFDSLSFTGMSVDNYHGVITYHFANRDANFRPYVFGGFGATRYAPDTRDGISFDNALEFSTTWGGGLKFYPRPNLGFKLGVRWTPTHIRSSTSGIFCNSRFGCFLIDPSKYSNQAELGAGVLFRF